MPTSLYNFEQRNVVVTEVINVSGIGSELHKMNMLEVHTSVPVKKKTLRENSCGVRWVGDCVECINDWCFVIAYRWPHSRATATERLSGKSSGVRR